MDIEIKVVKHNELEELNELISVFEDVFEMKNFKRPATAHLQKLLNRDAFFAIAAKSENKIIAGLTGMYSINIIQINR